MSAGGACNCEEKKKPVRQRRWFVLDRNVNYSAFNGYHRTPSDYSAVMCRHCGAIWRTKANYVVALADDHPLIPQVPQGRRE